MVTLEEAKKVRDKLVKTIQPISIIAFGSVARKGHGNDLDILIVIDDHPYSTHNFNKIVYKALHEFSSRFAIDPFIISLSKLREYFSHGSPFLRAVQKEGRVLYMKESIKEWMKQAGEELAAAKYLLQGGFYRGACYHAQQTIEKFIKASLLQKGWELEKIHSLERLLTIAVGYNIPIKIDEEDIIFIDSIYRGRYPAEEGLLPLGEPSEQDAQRAVELAGKMSGGRD